MPPISPLPPDAPHARDLTEILRGDPIVGPILRVARDLALPDWLVVSGAIYQTVWNTLTGKPSGYGLKDVDLVYFDGGDLSFEGEDRVIRHADAIFGDRPIPIELRNQARVHLWFEERFGSPYAPIGSSAEGLTRYASVTHAVGVRLGADGTLDVFAPFGLEDVFALRLRPNPALPGNGPTHDAKAVRMKALWPELTVVPWPTAP